MIYLADQREKLSVFVKTVKIKQAHIDSCEKQFNELVAATLERHKDSGLTLWQSCAMIEQCWGFFETDYLSDVFQEWFFSQVKPVKSGTTTKNGMYLAD